MVSGRLELPLHGGLLLGVLLDGLGGGVGVGREGVVLVGLEVKVERKDVRVEVEGAYANESH